MPEFPFGRTRPALGDGDEVDAADPPAGLDARARAWHASGDPRSLWPALEPRALAPAAARIERCVISLLDGGSTSLAGTGEDEVYATGIAALLSGTGPLLGYWVERGLLDVSTPLATILARHLEHGRRRIGRMTREVLPAVTALRHGGVSPCIIKGFHTAHEYFPEPGVRPMADVDVVVAADDVGRAEEILRTVGFVPNRDVLEPYKRDWHPPESDRRLWSVELWHHRGAWKLDLHDGINFPVLTRHGVRLEQSAPIDGTWNGLGVPVRVATQPLLLAMMATHLSGELVQTRLIRLVELIHVVRRDRASGVLDWAELEGLFERSRSLRFAYPALALAERLAPGTIDARLLRRARAASTRLARRVVDQFGPTSPIVPDRVSLAERFMWVSTPLEFARRVVMMASPVRSTSPVATMVTYYGRVRRALTGRVSWRVQPTPPVDENPAT